MHVVRTLPSARRPRRLGLALLLLLAACSRGDSAHDLGVPWEDAQRPVALLLDATAIANAPRGGTPGDLQWADLLEAEFGGVDVLPVPATAASATALARGRRLLVVPRHSGGAIGREVFDALEAELRTGLDVLFEAPDTLRSRWLGLEVATVERAVRLPWPDDDVHPMDPGRDPGRAWRPPAMRFEYVSVRHAPAFEPGRRATVVHGVAGRPFAWALPVGSGRFQTIAHDCGEWTRRWLAAGPVPPHGERPQPRAERARWVEAWQRLVLDGEFGSSPRPRWATGPSASDGWLVLAPSARIDPNLQGPAFSAPVRAVAANGSIASEWSVAAHLRESRLDENPSSPSGLPAELRRNAQDVRGAVVIALDASTVEAPPSALREAAAAHSHRITDVTSWLRWWEARARSSLRWNFANGVLTVDVTVDPEATEGLVLELPTRWQQKTLVDWSGEPSPTTVRLERRFSARVLCIDVPAGASGTFRFDYRPPQTVELDGVR